MRKREKERENKNQRLTPLGLAITSLFTASCNVIRHSSALAFPPNVCYTSETRVPFHKQNSFPMWGKNGLIKSQVLFMVHV